MKKIVALLAISGIMLSGCDNVVEMGKDEVITGFSFQYDADESEAGCTYYELNIDFSKEDVIMAVDTLPSGRKNNYTVTDKSKLMEYLRELVSHPDNQTEKSYKESPPKQLVWSFDVETDTSSYRKTCFDDYPDYWDELFEVLIETTEAESLEDFGFGDTDKFETYTITEKTLNESNEAFIKEIKYPYLENEKDKFKDINKQIVDVINEFDIFQISDDSEIQWSYWNTYEVVEQTYDNIFVKFNITAYPVGNPDLTKVEYILNIDLINEIVSVEGH